MMSDSNEWPTFAEAIGDPNVWQSAGRDFLQAANYLLDWYDPPKLPGEDWTIMHGGDVPMFVLYAAAVENLLKACRVAKDGSPLKDGRVPKEFANHDLVKHAAKAELPLQGGDKDLLEHLGDFARSGRYPLPLAEGDNPRARLFTTPDDVERVWSLLERIEAVLAERYGSRLPAIDVRVRHRPVGYGIETE